MKMINFYIADKSGATAVEFALIGLIFISTLFAIIEAGRVFWIQNGIQYALEVASRERLVDSDLSDAEVMTAAEEALESMMLSAEPFDVSVDITTISDVVYLEMDATYQYTPMIVSMTPDSWVGLTLEAKIRRPLMWDEE